MKSYITGVVIGLLLVGAAFFAFKKITYIPPAKQDSAAIDMTRKAIDFESMLQLTADLTKAYPHIYSRLMKANGSRTYTPEQKQWQKIRRGRYVEYNLIYDRGTKFGLESGGNSESILVSLPSEVEFHYQQQPAEGTDEALTLRLLKKGIDWTTASP